MRNLFFASLILTTTFSGTTEALAWGYRHQDIRLQIDPDLKPHNGIRKPNCRFIWEAS